MSDKQAKARDLLDALGARYSSMHSYRDQGTVYSTSSDRQSPYELTFHTLYSAPDLFRFEFSAPHPYPPLNHIRTRHIVGSDGSVSYVWVQCHQEPPELTRGRDLSLAIAGATGVSHGAAHTVARLILPKVGGFSLLELGDLGMLEDTVVDGTLCYQIAGRHPHGQRHVVVIEQTSLLLRKVRYDDGTDDVDEEIRYSIRVDEPTDAAGFAPPKE